jgi:hypothetical protein
MSQTRATIFGAGQTGSHSIRPGYLPLKYSKSLADSYFATAYYQEKIKAYIDNLNLLYVAHDKGGKLPDHQLPSGIEGI